ncbi:MAG: hypothetical protein EBT03_09335 [Betaproteobacteria bacterium]|nr:hypothetical protein [Verrucomicrobiota bacterium]NBS79684.1 hypothetical protein [bacterium]NBT35723.1 hypothetical protein [Betaproteobacteria bacterium]NCA17124.1 hypothetical protein [Betaproteobacteria bacterium]
MANTLGTTNANIIAQRALEILVEDYSFIRNAVTDFSPEAAKYNATVYTHRLSALTAQDYSQANGYVATAATQTDAGITLNKFKHVTYSVDDQERSTSQVNLIERFAGAAANALGLQMVGDLLALVTTSYGSAITVSSTSFNYSWAVSAGQVLNNNKVPANDRYAVLAPAFFGSLLKDSNVVANPQISGEAVRNAGLGAVAGFNINMYPSVPSNSITLGGFFAQREALLIASRVPEIPQNVTLPGTIENVTEPKTGLTIQSREVYNIQTGVLQRTLALIYGVARGETSSLVRINGA